MARTYVITGTGSGIGLATKNKLVALGNKVVGVDIKNAEVIADLSTPEGRKEAANKAIDMAGGTVDAVIANAGSALPTATTVSINFFGATEFISAMNSSLAKSKSPRVAITSSMASLMPNDKELVDLMLAGDERKAVARAQALEPRRRS